MKSKPLCLRHTPQQEVRPIRLRIRFLHADAFTASTMTVCPWKSPPPAIVPCGFIFMSYSVIFLSFSSFCYPSVDCGCMASLPRLGCCFAKVVMRKFFIPKAAFFWIFWRGASRLCASLAPMGESKRTSLHTAGTAMLPSFAMQISKRCWYKAYVTPPNRF